VAYNAVADNTGHSIFIRLALLDLLPPESAKSREILRNSNLQQFKVIDLGVNRKRIICDFLLVIKLWFSRYWRLKLVWLVFH